MTPHSSPARSYRATNPADLLAVVPTVFGFHPEDSVVVMTVGEAGHPFHARSDLPHDPDDVVELAEQLVATAVRHRLRQVALVVYSDDDLLAAGVAEAFADRFEAEAITVRLCLRADGERWFGLLGSASLVPDEGTPYDVSSHPFTVEAVVDGRVTYASREELRDSLVATDPDEVDAVARAADAALDRMTAAGRHPLGPAAPAGTRAHLAAEGHWVVPVVRRFLAAEHPLSADEVGRLLVALVAIDVRDAAWAEMDRASAERHVRLWRDVLRRSPAELRAAPAALLGFAAWLSGDGALAWCAVDACQEAEPDYRLAELLTQALAAAVPPSTWTPVGRATEPPHAG